MADEVEIAIVLPAQLAREVGALLIECQGGAEAAKAAVEQAIPKLGQGFTPRFWWLVLSQIKEEKDRRPFD